MTSASDTRPTVRRVQSSHGPLVVEVRERLLVLRPVGSRRGGPAEVAVTAGLVYQLGIEAAIRERRKAKAAARKAKRRGAV